MSAMKFSLQKEKEKGLKIGLKKGREEGVKKVALQMLKAGVDIEEICRFTELTPEEVEALNEMAEV